MVHVVYIWYRWIVLVLFSRDKDIEGVIVWLSFFRAHDKEMWCLDSLLDLGTDMTLFVFVFFSKSFFSQGAVMLCIIFACR